MSLSSEQARTWARAQAARVALLELAALVERETLLMPLKGIELVFRYGVPATERPMLDFDALVAPRTFDRVIPILEASGYRMLSSNYSTKVMLAPGAFVPVDVHRMVLPPMMGRWERGRLFRRGELRSDVYGARMIHARPADFFVVVAAHCLKDRLPPARAPGAQRDLLAVAAATSPAAVAASAEDARLRLTSWLVLTWLERRLGGDAPLAAFRRALEPPRAARLRGERVVAQVERWRESHRETAYALARSNTDEAWRGVLSAGLSFARAGRDAWRRVRARGEEARK